jgi:hypothetical protein
LVLVALPACTEGGSGEQATTDFVVDNPGSGNGGSDPSDGGDETGSATAGDDGDAGEGGDGEREVSEADIVFVEGDKLFALSAYSGLAVVDVSAPSDALPVLGRHRMQGMPFEMYVDGGQVFAILSESGTYAWDEEASAYVYHTASRLMALDASDPADIAVRGEFEMPGTIQDSRRVGDILYLVTYEDGWCWGCEEEQERTVVTSLDVSNPAAVEIVDQLAFAPDGDDEWDWSGPRSVSSTNERMYVGGIEFDGWEDAHSTIDVIDISDPGGVMVRGASVTVAGSIQSRWQMDEHEGILRVISQPWQWWSDSPPQIQTFTVASASDVAPLASVDMTLPRPETLQSVRFDGARAYAITFEQTDPLFTIDLADPAVPKQVGELEIPGWVYHMEPKGDRILALGFDNTNADGAINVSLFDVSDFASPALLSRVNFGGDWASFAEDQNRIHKAFAILDELGLVLVPFAGWEFDEESFDSEWGCGSYKSGIQLVDWSNDALALRGVAPANGQARRALVHRERLLAMSDKSLEAFDITNRDAPTKRASLALAANVSAVAFGDGIVVRLANDWWTNEIAIEVVAADDPDAAEPLGRAYLSEVENEFTCGYSWPVDLFVHGGYAYLLRETWDEASYESKLVLDTIDVNEPTAPVWLSAIDLPFGRSWGSSGLGLRSQEKMAVLAGDAMVFSTSANEFDGEQYLGESGTLEVVDLSSPAAPVHAATLERPDARAYGALQVFDDTVVSWHMQPVGGDETKVRFYVDRFDASASALEALDPINVPGQVVGYDEGTQRVVTVGFDLEVVQLENCWEHPKQWYTGWDSDDCTIAHRPLHLLALDGDRARLLDTLDVEGDEGRLGAVMLSDSRLFAEIREGTYEYGTEDDGWEPLAVPEDLVAVITGHDGDALVERSRVAMGHQLGWSVLFGVKGDSAFFRGDAGIGSIDASDAESPRLAVTPYQGWGCWEPEVGANAVYCPLGEYGLQVIAFPQAQ